METAVYIFAGFLNSGKTTALQESLLKTVKTNNVKSIIICTEEGEEEYRMEELKSLCIDVVEVENEEDFTEEFLEKTVEEYMPENVYIEYNGMWDLKAFLDITMPKGWYIANIFSLVDAGTYEIYLKNMRQTLMNPLSVSDVILFNRCGDGFQKGKIRRSLKILNSRAELFFIKPNGSIDYDMDEFFLPDEKGTIDVTDEVFCSWFVDCIENTDKYYGKKVRFSGIVTRGKGLAWNQFYVGRYIAVCCQEDAQFVGFIAESETELPMDGDWIEIEARIEQGEIAGKRMIILLKIIDMRKMEVPGEIFLYF